MQEEVSIAAVVVTFNRTESLIRCIAALLGQTRQLDEIYIIDNASTENTLAALQETAGAVPSSSQPDAKGIINLTFRLSGVPVHYVRMPENTGSAGGFHEGARRSFQDGHDWIWLMDDDCLPEKFCLEHLAGQGTDPGNAYLPYIMDYTGTRAMFSRFPVNSGVHVVDHGPFNGFYICRKTINAIGFPDKTFFMYKDDFEYCFRVQGNGGRLVLVSGAHMLHPKRTFSFSGLVMSALNKRCIFYGLRNTVYTHFRHQRPLPLKSIARYSALFVFCFFTFRWQWVKLMLKAVHDATHGILGKNPSLEK